MYIYTSCSNDSRFLLIKIQYIGTKLNESEANIVFKNMDERTLSSLFCLDFFKTNLSNFFLNDLHVFSN